MHSINLTYGSAGTQTGFLFKDEAKARAVYADVCKAVGVPSRLVAIADEFGREIAVRSIEISSVEIENMEISGQAGIERGLHRARPEADGQRPATLDPKLRRAAAGPSHGPPRGRG